MSRYAELITELRMAEQAIPDPLRVPGNLAEVVKILIANQLALMRGVAEILESLPDKPCGGCWYPHPQRWP